MNYLYKNIKNYASDFESNKSRKLSNFLNIFAFLVLLLVFGNAKAATITSTTTGGNWNATSTWAGGVIPSATDDVVLGTNATITVTADASCATLTFGTATQTTTLNINTGITLNVSGLITIPRASSGMNSIAVGAGILNAGSITFTVGGGSSRHKITITTGTVSVSGDVTQVGSTGSATIAFSGAGLLKIGGAFMISGTCTLTQATGSTVEYYGASQTIQTFAYNNLVLSGSGTKTFAAVTTISGNLSIASGVVANLSTFSSTAATLTLGGTAQTSGGSTYGGTNSIASTINTIYFATNSGVLTIGTGCSAGTWFGTTNTDWNTASNWCNGVIPTSTTNVTINSGGNQPSIGTAGGLCNNISINTGATLTISGTNTLTVSGNWTNNGTFAGSVSTVVFNGTTQSIGTGPFSNLTFSGSGVKTTTGVTVNGILSMEGTATTTGTSPAYGSASTLKYNGTGAQTTGTEFPTTFSGSGGVIIANTGGTVTFATAKTISGNLNINTGAIVNLGTGLNHTSITLTLGGTAQTTGATYGGTGTAGSTINSTYFAAASGKLTVGTVCVAGTWLGTTSTDWNTASNWCNATLPTASIDVIINSGGNQPTINGSAFCKNITISGTLIISATGTLAVSGSITKNGTLTLNTGSTINYEAAGTQTVLDIAYTNLIISGSGTKTQTFSSSRIFSGNLFIGGGATYALGGTSSSKTLTVSGNTDISGTFNLGTATASKTFTGNVTINSGGVWNEGSSAAFNFAGNLVNNATLASSFTASTGVHTFTGSAKTFSGSTSTVIPTVTITGTYTNSGTLIISTTLSGSGSLTQDTNSTLNIGGTSTITTFSPSAVGNNVNYTGTNQTVLAKIYNNLTISGAVKTFPSGTTTVNGVLSIENGTSTNVFTGTIAYGSSATLQYNAAASPRTVSSEWPATFLASGGVLIKGTGVITLNTAKVLGTDSTVPLNITTGAKLSTSNFGLTFNGDFTNAGTFTAGSSPITITGTTTIQNIAGFTTTGAVSMTKNSGVANVSGAISAAALTINGTSGTLNLGTSLTHTFSGNVTLTSGTLNGGVLNTIKVNSSSTTAWNGSGSVFVPGTSTVVFGGVAQTLAATSPSFYNVSFSGTGTATKTITNSLTVANNINIISSAKLLLTTGTSATTKVLQFGGVFQAGGSWGFTGSSAGNINTTYFITGGTGIINSSTAQRFVITGAATQIAGANQNITITAENADGSTFTTYTGDKSITFSGASSSPNGTAPTIKDKTGTLVPFGTPTTITFESGVATVSGGNNGVMSLYKTEIATIAAVEGLITSTGSDRLFVTVSNSASTNLVFTAQPNGGNTNEIWSIQPVISWQDTYSNPVLGTVNDVTLAITNNPSSGTLNGTKTVALSTVSGTATFSGLTIDKSGTGYTLTATPTTGTSGTSTVFDISNPVPTLSNISPSTVCSGGSAFTLSINGSNFNAASVVKVNGLARTTTFEDSANITAEILASDIVNGGINYITVYTPAPGGGGSSSVTLTVVQPSLNSNIIQPSCFSDGSITLSPTGGTSPYTYDWTDLSGTSNPKDRSGLLPANYSVLVTDASGCFANSGTITMTAATNCSGITVCKSDTAAILSVPPDPNDTTYTWTLPSGAVGTSTTNSISVDWTGVSVGGYNVTIVGNNSCGTSASSSIIVYVQEPTASASADLACSGGNLNLYASGGVSYSWTGPNSYTSQSANPEIYNISSAQSGTYTVTVTNAAGCSKTASVSVTINTPPTIIDGSITQSTNGNSIGAIPITVSGGSTYSYLWTAESSAFSSTSQNLTGIPSDNYKVVVTNQTGCTASKTYTVSNSDGPSATATGINSTCNGSNNGSISLSNPTGTGPFTYSWSGPNSYSSSQQSPTGLASGTYTVLITDTSNSTTGVASATITQPSALQANGITTNINCNSETTGAIALTVSGGSSPYTYSWSGPNSYSASLKDISSLAAGTYYVTITDASSCTSTQTFIITQPTDGLSATTSITNVSCYGSSTGQVILSVNGGTSPYTYSWNGTSFTASTKDISNRPEGTYSVTITDNKGCTLALASGTAIVIAQPAAALSLSTSSTNVNCKGNATGTITLTASGGTAPYSYSWSNGDTTKDLSNIAAGTYTVVVNDANSCIVTKSVTISQPAANLSASNSTTNVSCNGGTTGEINLTATGGTTPYIYLWSTNATTEDLSAITSGTYSVVVTDANGCTSNSSATLTQPAAISVSGSVTNVLCNGSASGAITLTASGGAGTYTYNWGGGITSQNRTNLVAGSYTVTVMDTSSCNSAATSFVITQSPSIVLNPVNKNISCKSASNGSISLSVTGGNYPYSYSWTGSYGFIATTQNIDNIPAGTYEITVTDANSCSASENGIVLTQPSAAVSIVTTPTAATCKDGSNGSISAIASGGTSPYSYAWSTGANTASITGLSKGPYSILVTDANGCTLNQNINVSEPPTKLELYANVKESSSCGNATGSIELTVVNGNAPFSYAWTNTSQTSANPSSLGAGTFTATVTDTIGCSAILNATIANASALSASVTTYPKTCLYNDGSAYALVTGGVAPYTFSWNNGATSQNIGLLGSGTVSVTITDANGCTTSSTGMVGSISCLAPIAVNDTFNTNYQTALTVTVATNDSDPDALDQDHPNLQYFSTQNPTAAQGVLNWGTDYDGNFTFVPAVGFSGTFTLTYEVFDPTGLSATGTYTITVGPSAVNDALGTPLNTVLTSNVYSNDYYATGSVFSKLSEPTHGTIIFNSAGTFTYTPTNSYAGDDSFTYKICLGTPNQSICSNTATVLISVDGSADVSVSKTISNATPNVGSNVVFILTAINSGPNLALGVNVTDALPAGYTYVSNTTAAGSFDSTTGVWTVGSLANASSATLQITATVNPTGNYTNTASISSDSTDPGISNNSASVSASPVPQSDISISGSVNNASQSIGSSVTFTITVTNSGPNNATGVNVSDLLPNGFTYTSSTVDSGTYDNSTGIWTISNLSNGSSVTLTITAIVNNSGNYTNTAVVSSNTNDPTSSNNSSSQEVTPGAVSNLSLTKTINNANPYVGGLVEFTLTATNNGPSNASGVSVIDSLPSGYTYDSNNGNGAYSTATGKWTIGNLNNGAIKKLKIYAIVKSTGNYTNSATISSTDQPDSDTSNNNPSVSPTSVIAQADLSVVKTVNTNEAVIGNNVIFTLAVTNSGPSDATGVSVTDLLPSGYTYVSSSTTSGTYTSGSGIWAVGAVSNGATKTITITVTVNSTGNYINVASVNGTTTDLSSGNNTSSKTVTPIPLLIINNPSAICYPATVDITASAITSGSSSNLTYSYWNDSNSISPSSTPTQATNGTYYIKATTSSGNFTVEPVFVTVNPASVAGSISGATSVCSGTNSTALTLAGNTGNVTKWQYSSDNFASDVHDVANTTSSLTATNLTETTYYRAVVKSGVCDSATTNSVSVLVNSAPSITSVTNGSHTGTGVADLGAASNGGTIYWYTSAVGGSSLATGTSYTTTSLTNTTSYYVEVIDNGCTSSVRSEVIATINPILIAPTITSTTPNSVCPGIAITLSAISSSGIVSWYSSSTGGTLLGTGNSYTIDSLLATTTYYVDATDGDLTTDSRTAIVATLLDSSIGEMGTISGPTILCLLGTNVATYSVTPVQGAIYYQWSFPQGVTSASSVGSSVTITFDSSMNSGEISVKAINACGLISNTSSIYISKNSIPRVNIQGKVSVCNITTVSYSAPYVEGGYYNWSLPPGMNIVSGDGTRIIVVSIDPSFEYGTMSLTVSTACGDSLPTLLYVSIASIAEGFVGPSEVCTSSIVTYTTPLVAGVTEYNWSLPFGMTIVAGEGTNSISVQIASDFISGQLGISLYGACTSGTIFYRLISAKFRTHTIIGPTTLCAIGKITYDTNGNIVDSVSGTESYHIDQYNGATAYNWTVPLGVTIVSGQNTNTIVVTFNLNTFNSGVIGVSVPFTCGVLQSNISISKLGANAKITGAKELCSLSTASYSVPTSLSNHFTWSVPSWMTIVSGQNTNTINVSVSGVITSSLINVSFVSNCGLSEHLNLNVGCSKSSQIQASQCGVTLSNLSANIYAIDTYNSEGYLFEVSSVSTVSTFESLTNSFKLTQLTGSLAATYGQTYSIRVALKYNGVWQSYGTACNVTTPSPAISGDITSTNSNVCIGSNNTTLSVIGSFGTLIWQKYTAAYPVWVPVGNSTSSIEVSNLTTTTLYRVIASNGGSTAISNIFTIIVNPLAKVGIISPSIASVCTGGNITLTSATYIGSSIQWEMSTTSATTGFNPISNATGLQLILTNVTAVDPGSSFYVRTIVTSGNCSTATSTAKSILVNSPAIAGTITGGGTVCNSGIGTLKLIGNVGSAQWQYSTDNTNYYNVPFNSSTLGYVNTNGANTFTTTSTNGTASSYLVNNITAPTYFRVKVTSGACDPLYTNSVQYIIGTAGIAGIISGPGYTLCAGSGATLSLNGSVGNIQWQKSTSLNGNYSNITGATGSTLATGVLANTTYYKATVTIGSCAPILSAVPYTVSISKAVVGALTALEGLALCNAGSGTTGSKTLILSGASGTKFELQSSLAASGTYTTIQTKNVNLVSGIVNFDTVYGISNTTYYKVLVTAENSNGDVCSTAISNTPTTITVTNTFPGNIASIGGTSDNELCNGTNTILTLSSNSIGNISWRTSGNGTSWTTVYGATTSSLTTSNLTVNTYYKATITPANGCVASTTYLVYVKSAPLINGGTITGINQLCASNTGTTLTASGYQDSGSIVWERATLNTNSTTGTVTIGTFTSAPTSGIVGVSTSNSETTYNTGVLVGSSTSYVYRVKITATFNSCIGLGYSSIFKVYVLKTPSIISSNSSSTICNVASTYLSLPGLAQGPNYSYVWYKLASNSTISEATQVSTSASYYLPSLTMGIYYYKVRVNYSSGACSSSVMSGVYTITVSNNNTCKTNETEVVNEVTTKFDATVYPNPFGETFKLNVKTNSIDSIEVKIYDMLGKQLEILNLYPSELEGLEVGANYTSGVYNVILSQGDNIKTIRVIKR